MIWLKRSLSLAALGVLIYLFWPLVGEIEAAAGLFKTANWAWLPLVLSVYISSYIFLTWLNSMALQPFDGDIRFPRLAAVLTSIAFIEVAIPSAGASGIALRARLLGKHGHFSFEGSTFSLLLEIIYLSFAMVTLALLGLFYLAQRGQISNVQLSGLGIGITLIVLALWSGWRVIHNPTLSKRILFKLADGWNKLGRGFLPIEKVALNKRLTIFHMGLKRLGKAPRWKFILAAFGRVTLDVVTLGLCFVLFQHQLPLGTLFVGYGITLLISGLASVPGGLGLADASIPVIFASLGVPGAVALAAGLTYRLIAYWLVRFIGFVSWQVLESQNRSFSNQG
jgi:uncharacterized protein (TIRG00374 family)